MNMMNIKVGFGREFGLLKELVVVFLLWIDFLMYLKMRNINID